MRATIEVHGIAAGGAGVGRLPDGRVTFVHRTAPGDEAEVRIVEEKPRWTRSRLASVRKPSALRREAPCPHYDLCGGCQLEHMVYDAQLEAKAQIVADVLLRIGKKHVARPAVVPSPSELRYRNRVTFTLRREPAGVVAGLHEIDHPDRLVDITDCLLAESALASAWRALRDSWGPGAGRLPSGEELRLTLRTGLSGEVTLAVGGGYGPGRPEELLAAVEPLVAIWHRAAERGAYRLLAGAALRDRWDGEELELSGDVFTQVNRQAAELLESHVLERSLARDPRTAIDAYCGVGLRVRRFERAGVRATGIEAHPEAAAEARRAARASRIIEGTVEACLEDALPADVVILNPPRAGVDLAVVDALTADVVPALLYVSCDPATLARDLRRLEGTYGIEDVRCFDLFPQTAHVETVVELTPCAIT
jgi:23S rRNA (uracil1939-C5)-methyltransferase